MAQREMEVWEKAWFHSELSISGSGILVFQSSNDFAPELIWTDASGIEQGRIRQRGYQRNRPSLPIADSWRFPQTSSTTGCGVFASMTWNAMLRPP